MNEKNLKIKVDYNDPDHEVRINCRIGAFEFAILETKEDIARSLLYDVEYIPNEDEPHVTIIDGMYSEAYEFSETDIQRYAEIWVDAMFEEKYQLSFDGLVNDVQKLDCLISEAYDLIDKL